ncbi:MAG: hypothetical protein LBK60_02460 [Verrucomicrobiales bacterium]|jgi:hypothetical protein|nr:hypothetical protein [Verrucomicrobiales bacterium]
MKAKTNGQELKTQTAKLKTITGEPTPARPDWRGKADLEQSFDNLSKRMARCKAEEKRHLTDAAKARHLDQLAELSAKVKKLNGLTLSVKLESRIVAVGELLEDPRVSQLPEPTIRQLCEARGKLIAAYPAVKNLEAKINQ